MHKTELGNRLVRKDKRIQILLAEAATQIVQDIRHRQPIIDDRLERGARNVSVEAVGQALCATGYPALRDIQIDIERGIVVLWGRVPTYHQKQLAQVTAQRVDGVRGIANGIEVVSGR